MWPRSQAPGVCAPGVAWRPAAWGWGKQPGRVGGAAVGSGKRVTWGLGRRAHVSGGNGSPAAAQSGGGTVPGSLPALWGRAVWGAGIFL